MTAGATIRAATHEDRTAVRALYPLAFPDEDLLPLIAAMWAGSACPLMLVAERDGEVAGHISLAPCTIGEGGAEAALLGPLAVHPDHQRRGIGTALIRDGLRRLPRPSMVCVLGDPAHYGRHGFLPERGIAPPYPLPDEWAGAWQSMSLGATRPLTGRLSVPEYWRDPALWGP